MAQTILYYPKIDIQDGVWLRNAILYWDEVSSIVPNAGFEDFSPDLQYLRSLGVYTAVFPRDLFASDYFDEFTETAKKRIKDYVRADRNTFYGRHSSTMYERRKNINDSGVFEMIHQGKIPDKLHTIFEDYELVRKHDFNEWLEMDSTVLSIYMRTLAEYFIKSSDKDMVLGTDNPSYNHEIYRVSRHKDVQTQCCQINLLKCLPMPSMEVSFEEILEFKNKRKDELQEFLSKIRELETEIYNADSLELIRHYETQFNERVSRGVSDFRKVLTEARIKFSLSSLSSFVAIPYVTQLMDYTGGSAVLSIVKTALPVLTIGICYLDYKNKISPVKSDGGFSYIFNAQREGIITKIP